MVMRPQPRRAVVFAAGSQRRAVKGVDCGAVFGGDGDVEFAIEPAFAADPEIRLAVRAETSGRGVAIVLLHLPDERVSKRLQRLCVKSLGSYVVSDGESNVVNHGASSRAAARLLHLPFNQCPLDLGDGLRRIKVLRA